MRRVWGMLPAALLALAGPAAAQRDPVNTDRLIRRIERLPTRGDENLIRAFGLPEWNARVLAAAEQSWIDSGQPATVVYRSRLPSGFNFDRYELTRVAGRDGRPAWTGRWMHMRRVEVTDAASRTFPLDAVWRAYQRHGRNAASPAFQQERQRLLPDPTLVGRAVLVRVETANSARCSALTAVGERALALRNEQPRGAAVAVPDGQAPHTLTVGGVTFRGPRGSPSGGWGENLWRQTANCWRLQSINNADRR